MHAGHRDRSATSSAAQTSQLSARLECCWPAVARFFSGRPQIISYPSQVALKPFDSVQALACTTVSGRSVP
ncbi:hypothetical protein PsYK624_172270 [Phanerochaete sordida]|uniref:Uncharacterized protein n=1 Tax=Phanerochaete sordida TaxID=48140 RepID=A0A9P3GS72_9APHY|nr:hypothetical protein PsYK624_172270 [Phanerochaete sordida]